MPGAVPAPGPPWARGLRGPLHPPPKWGQRAGFARRMAAPRASAQRPPFGNPPWAARPAAGVGDEEVSAKASAAVGGLSLLRGGCCPSRSWSAGSCPCRRARAGRPSARGSVRVGPSIHGVTKSVSFVTLRQLGSGRSGAHWRLRPPAWASPGRRSPLRPPAVRRAGSAPARLGRLRRPRLRRALRSAGRGRSRGLGLAVVARSARGRARPCAGLVDQEAAWSETMRWAGGPRGRLV